MSWEGVSDAASGADLEKQDRKYESPERCLTLFFPDLHCPGRATEDLVDLINASPNQRLRLLELASTLAQTKLVQGKNFEDTYHAGKLSDFLAKNNRFFMAGSGPLNSRTIMLNRYYKPPAAPVERSPESTPADDARRQGSDVEASPSAPGIAEISFARFLFELRSKRAHIGSDVGIFLKRNNWLPEGTTVTMWLQKRSFLFRIVDMHYVEMQRPGPKEDKEAFLDRVLGGLLTHCGSRALHLGSHLGVVCKYLNVDMNKQLRAFFMARPSKYRIVGNDFVTLTAGQQSSQQQQQQPAPVSTQPTPVRSEVSSAHLSHAPSPRSEPSSTAVDRPATPREGAVRSLTASSALQQVNNILHGQAKSDARNHPLFGQIQQDVTEEVTQANAQISELRQQLEALQLQHTRLRQDFDEFKRLQTRTYAPFGSTPVISNAPKTSAVVPAVQNGPHSSGPPKMLPKEAPPPAKTSPELPQFGTFAQPFNPAVSLGLQEGLVVLGGHDGNWLSTCATYTPGERGGRWGKLPDLPRPLAFAAAVSLGSSVYVTGGGNGIDWYDSVFRCDTANTTVASWKPMAPMLHKRGNHAAVQLAGHVYVMGGGQMGLHYKHAEKLDPERNQWISISAMNTPRSSVKAATDGRAIYIVGGYDGEKYLSTAERFDPREGRWQTLPGAMSTQRGSLGVASLPGSIFAVGGYDSKQALCTAERLDTAVNSWMPLPDLHSERVALCAVTVQGQVHAVGGAKSDMSRFADALERWEVSSKSWASVSGSGTGDFMRSFAAACTFTQQGV